MYLTQREIFGQYEALRKTYLYLLENSQAIKDVFENHKPKSLTFIGSGSGYTLCHSGELSAKLRLNMPANALAAGDLLINFQHYTDLLNNSMIITASRSGATSEVVLTVERAKEIGVPTIAISAKKDAPLSRLAELILELPWAFDESVCQTRTVTNFYLSNLLIIGIIADDQKLIKEIDQAISVGSQFMAEYTGLIKEVSTQDWNKVLVLADSELEGIASEAALAFSEIAQIPSNYYHVLDVRHGPMVLVDEKSLVILAVSPEETELQRDLIKDLKANKAKVVSLSTVQQKNMGSDWEIYLPVYKNFGVMGIPFIFVPQAISFYKALELGLNPDKPGDLKAQIDLV